MIPTIGFMIGLYILTRMVELVSTSQKSHLRILGALSGVGSVIGMAALMTSSSSISDLAGRDLEQSTIAPSGIGMPQVAPLIAPGSMPLSSWNVHETRNPLDDSPTVVLTLDAVRGSSRLGRSPSLILRCRSNKTDVYINWNDYLGSDETDVVTRIGRSPAQTHRWSLSTDNNATFYPGNAIGFITVLAPAEY